MRDTKQTLNMTIFENEEAANAVISQIIADKGCVIGVDIEAAVEMSRFGIPCLLQVS